MARYRTKPVYVDAVKWKDHWIITDAKGRKNMMTDEAFRAEYECLDGGYIIIEDEVTP